MTVVAVPATNISGGNAQPIDEVVSSVNGEPEAFAAKVAAALAATPGAIDVTSSAVADAPQFDIEFNRDRARALDERRHRGDRDRSIVRRRPRDPIHG
jgi:multidrug efflux pump subunit AcrB